MNKADCTNKGPIVFTIGRKACGPIVMQCNQYFLKRYIKYDVKYNLVFYSVCSLQFAVCVLC